jgi:hypothetical protein
MRKKRALKEGFHVLTVRFLDDEWAHFQAVQANLEKKERRRVPFTEIIVGQILEMPRRG